VFVDGSRVTDPTRNLGSMLSVWCDDPSPTEDSFAAGIHNRLRVMAQQTWGSPKPVPLYVGFLLWIGAVGDAPA
jgi:hexosaminidase